MDQAQQVRFTWNIHWSCNYRCTYCFFDEHWTEYGKRNVYQTVEEWMEHWRRIHALYGQCYLTINGGEPFAYPNFIELLVQVSQLHWPINVTTNTSLHLKEYVERIDHSKVSISISFHPQYHAIDEFLKTLLMLRFHRVNLGCINFVAWPPFLKDMPEYVRRFQERGESLKVIPFVGTYEGRNYPDQYNAEEKKILGLSDEWIDSKRPKGRVCTAGNRSGLLLPTGKVARCGQIGDRYLIGDFFDPGFTLMKEPMSCDVEFCPCDEWKVVPDEKAPEKAGAWLP